MTALVFLKTDDRVHQVVRAFVGAPDWTVVDEIDSANCGEGYDLLWQQVDVRLYDSVRSDWVVARHRQVRSKGEWEAGFAGAVEALRGEVELVFQIGSWSQTLPALQAGAAGAVIERLRAAGYAALSIREEVYGS